MGYDGEMHLAFALDSHESLVFHLSSDRPADSRLSTPFSWGMAHWCERANEHFLPLEAAAPSTHLEERALFQGLALFFWFMPGGDRRFYDQLKPGSLPLLEVSKRTETLPGKTEAWVFFGGAFDPWHLGHRACLELCQQERMIVVPERGPWKDGKLTSWRDFWGLVDKTRDLAVGLYPGFLGRESAVPTIEWITQVEGRKAFLVGADHLRDFPKWHESQRLLSELEVLYVAPRAVRQEAALDELFHQWRDELQRLTKTPIVMLGHHPFEHLSSTLIRDQQKKGPE